MKLHQFEGYIQDIYLAEYEHGLLLLDGCSRADVELICHFIESTLSRPLTDLKLVVTTHMHPDHAGAASFLKQKSGCLIAAAKVDGNWYKGLDGYLMFITDMLLAKYVAKRKGKGAKYLWYKRNLKPDVVLKDGQALPYFPDWSCVFTQGHTDRCISLFHEGTNQIYVADLIVKVKGQLIPPFPIFYPNRYKRSIKRLQQINPAKVALAHGGFQTITNEQYALLNSRAPDEPVTHWRSVKTKLLTVLKKN